MNIKITFENSTIQDSRIASCITGNLDNAEIKLSGTDLINTNVLTDLDVNEFCSKCEQILPIISLNKEEYDSLKKVLNKRNNKKTFISALSRHLVSFTEGVVASIVATCITK